MSSGIAKAAVGWISKRMSPPTPAAISASENRERLDATRKKIDDAAQPERDRIMQQYQRRGRLSHMSTASTKLVGKDTYLLNKTVLP